MKRLYVFIMVLLLAGGAISAQVWETNAPANFKVNVAKNQYGEGYQWQGKAAWLFNKNQMKEGEEYELEIAFTSDVDIPELMIMLVDGHASVKYWKELAIAKSGDDWPTLNVAAKTPATAKIPFKVYHTATNAEAGSNMLVFDYKGQPKKSANLTFTKFTLRRTK